MLPLRFRSWALLVLPALLLGCDANADCEPIACQSGVSVTAQPSGSWKEGEYTLEVTHDGEVETCTFKLPYSVPTAKVTVEVDCGKSLSVYLAALTDCTQCTVDDEFQLGIIVDGLPTELAIQLSYEDEVVLSDERTVEYEDVYLRGEECGVSCTQSKYELDIEYPE